MPWSSKHVDNWLANTGKTIKTVDGKEVEVWEFRHESDNEILSAWAKHFRNHYCLDIEIDSLRDGTGLDRKGYLESVFPDKSAGLGPAIRSGDFAEILIADYLEYRMNYWVPRTRFNNKTVRNESLKGCDVVGFKFADSGKESPQDVLAIYESKAQFSSKPATAKLQEAVDGSAKDSLRKADTLNAIKRRLFDKGAQDDAKKVSRFQNQEDRPYTEIYGATAVLSTHAYDEGIERETTASKHPNCPNLKLLIIHGSDLMKLTHELFDRAANEAG